MKKEKLIEQLLGNGKILVAFDKLKVMGLEVNEPKVDDIICLIKFENGNETEMAYAGVILSVERDRIVFKHNGNKHATNTLKEVYNGYAVYGYISPEKKVKTKSNKTEKK